MDMSMDMDLSSGSSDSSSLSSSPDESILAEALSVHNKARKADACGSRCEAERLYHRALELIDPTICATHPTLASVWNDLGELYFHMGRFDDAEQWFGKSLDLSLSIRDLKVIATSRENLARVQRVKSELFKAKALRMLGAPDDMRCDNFACADGLLRSPNLSICGGCKKTFYCSQDCQRQDWERHKRRCHTRLG
ncbi:hypothetical protein C8Q80DRAFT_1131749 [Daedaleopsis nitida]|nr:hypothetical protein C8Q80DRAFT_1131749 [Daedaleopsis nitida]